MVSEAATVVMALADNSGSGGTGNGGGNRGSDRATTSNQNAAAVEAKMAVVAAAMDVAVSVAVAAAAAVAAGAIKRQRQIIVWPPWSEVTPPNASERGSTRTIIGEYRQYVSVFFKTQIGGPVFLNGPNFLSECSKLLY